MSETEDAGVKAPASTPLDFHVMWKSIGIDAHITNVTGSLIEDGFLKLFCSDGRGTFVRVEEVRLVSFEPT